MKGGSGDINRLVSLTFDEDPEVRKEAAKSLGELDDPAAVFALVELSYDKDPSVREVAHKTLEKKKNTEPELMSFAKIFSASGDDKKEKEERLPKDAKEKMLRPISKIFEKRLGKEKAEAVRKKMMPSIEKIYMKAHQHDGNKKTTGRKAMQEFLTNYLEVISDIDQIGDESVPALQAVEGEPEVILGEEISGGIPEVGSQPAQLEKISSEIANLEMEQVAEQKQHEEIGQLPDTFFKKAYEVMMLSGGDESVMKLEMNRMIQDAKREISLAFKLAKKKFKETKITNITKIKDRMRNINTETLSVVHVENMEYQKTKRQKAAVTRVLINDEKGNEGVVYLFEDRGLMLNSGMKLKITGGIAKTFKFSGETALTLGKKGNVYIVL